MLHSGSIVEMNLVVDRSVSCCQALFIRPGISHHALLLSLCRYKIKASSTYHVKNKSVMYIANNVATSPDSNECLKRFLFTPQ